MQTTLDSSANNVLQDFLRFVIGLRRPPKQPFNDPVLGEMQPCEAGWTVPIQKGEDLFTFTIADGDQPEAASLAHAREILNGYEVFKRSVKDCIESETRNYPVEAKAELAQMEIDDISLIWPHRPRDGIISFRGPADYVGLWRCDYVDGEPTGLGCDT